VCVGAGVRDSVRAGVEKRMYRNTNISVQGIGLQEYFSRVVQYREVRSMCLKMKDAMQTNEEIADLGGTHTHTGLHPHTHTCMLSRMHV
jgi:hypothetical protein